MAINITNVTDATFGNCVKLSNGQVEFLVTVDYGPRVIAANLCGMENMFYQDPEKKGLGEKMDIYGGDIHKLYGGHRLWIAPEILPRCYHPDNAPVICEPITNGMKFTASVEEKIGIRKSFTITLSETEAKASLVHEVENVGLWGVEFALWCVTMMEKGGKSVMPFTKRKTGLLPNRHLTLWDYSEMNDSRVYWGKEFVTLTQDAAKANPFKLGYSNEDGWGTYFNKGQLFVKKFKMLDAANYPDNGCSYETFTNDFMLEVETLSPMYTVAPGGKASHNEEWAFYKESAVPSNDENEIKELLAKYV